MVLHFLVEQQKFQYLYEYNYKQKGVDNSKVLLICYYKQLDELIEEGQALRI